MPDNVDYTFAQIQLWQASLPKLSEDYTEMVNEWLRLEQEAYLEAEMNSAYPA